MQVDDSPSASLLERKQVEKVCVHNIPEGGSYEWSYKTGKAAWVSGRSPDPTKEDGLASPGAF